MNLVIPLFLSASSLVSYPASADPNRTEHFRKCQILDHSSWHWTDKQLLLSSKSIFVGSVLSGAETKEKISTEINGTDYGVSHIRKIKWKIKVNSTLKGTRKTGEIVNIVSPKLVVPHNEIDRNNCLQSLDFKANAEYLVFENSFHPKGYLEVEKATDLLKLLKRQQSK